MNFSDDENNKLLSAMSEFSFFAGLIVCVYKCVCVCVCFYVCIKIRSIVGMLESTKIVAMIWVCL